MSDVPPEPQAKIEYDRLMAFLDKLLKYGAAVLAFLIAAAGVLLYQNIHSLESQAERSIKRTEESATREMSDIRSNAEKTAKLEAQKAIDAAFEKQNVQNMIERTAKTKVDAAVESEVQKNLGARIQAFRNLMTEIAEIPTYGAELRANNRSGLNSLVKKMGSSDPTISSFARSTLLQIGSEEDQRINQIVTADPNARIFLNEGHMGRPVGFHTPLRMMEYIHTQDPRTVAAAFYTMKEAVKWNVSTFDIPAAEKWCAAHKPQCDQ